MLERTGGNAEADPPRILGNPYNLLTHHSPFLKIDGHFGDRSIRFDVKIDSVDSTPTRHSGFPFNCAVLNSYTSPVWENQRNGRKFSAGDIYKKGSKADVTSALIKHIKVHFVEPGGYRDGSSACGCSSCSSCCSSCCSACRESHLLGVLNFVCVASKNSTKNTKGLLQ